MLKKFVCILIPFFVAIAVPIFLDNYLEKNIQNMLDKKELSEINKEYGSIYKDKGVEYNNYMAENDYTILQATSELKAPVNQVPTKFFPIKGLSKVGTVGMQGSQSLTQLSILGSQSDDIPDRKVAIIVSLQWFYSKKGVAPDAFQCSFAPVQFYNILNNDKISEQNKKRYAERLSRLLTGSIQYLPEKVYAKVYAGDNIAYKAIKIAFKPYFFMREKIVSLKDKGLLYKKLKSLPDKYRDELRTVNWNDEKKKAEEEGKKSITNNDFMVYDKYYSDNKSSLESKKDSLENVSLVSSKEFEDYELFLDTCNDLNVKPYIILMPANGKWYDDLGLSKETRDEFYDKAQKVAEEKGFEVMNLKDKEYTPYFMCDAAHFGWKGWLKVDEELYKHFKE